MTSINDALTNISQVLVKQGDLLLKKLVHHIQRNRLSTILASSVYILLRLLWTSDVNLYIRFSRYCPKSLPFKGKVVWVVGASSGIGRALAFDLARAGAQVVLSARRVNNLEDVKQAIARDIPGALEPFIVPLDLTEMDKHQSAIDSIINKFQQLDIVVLNSGKGLRSLAIDTSLAATRDLFELNLFSIISMTKSVLPYLNSNEKKEGGHLVVVSSLSGRIGTPITASYSATKHALHGYFDALRGEVQKEGIKVSLVCPGPVVSEIGNNAYSGNSKDVKPSSEEEDKAKMPTERCSYLIAKGIYLKVEEMWISPQPYFFLMFVNQYNPWFGRYVVSKLLGPKRVELLKAGKGIYDLSVK